MTPLIYVAGRYRAATREAVAANIEAARQVGIEAARRLNHDFPNIKIVALSIHRDKRYVAEMLRAGSRSSSLIASFKS